VRSFAVFQVLADSSISNFAGQRQALLALMTLYE
jgi:hypothetical protein